MNQEHIDTIVETLEARIRHYDELIASLTRTIAERPDLYADVQGAIDNMTSMRDAIDAALSALRQQPAAPQPPAPSKERNAVVLAQLENQNEEKM